MCVWNVYGAVENCFRFSLKHLDLLKRLLYTVRNGEYDTRDPRNVLVEIVDK